ncbi:MAG: S-layer homology domain-containing protein [Syntrophomonadaceae bacterium]|jgi:hypothetical protein|nr:S-layer homology domain-containing protein [Syntrophomonadaceae bacterium]
MFKRKVLSILLAMVFLLQLSPLGSGYAGAAEQNGDVPPEHWAVQNIALLLDKKIIAGDQNGDINPDNPITRAEFVTIVNKAFNFTETVALYFL